MVLFCDICSVEVQSEITMRDHLKGKKHVRLSALLNKHKQQAASSIFVKAFKKETTENELKSYFSHYGKIDSFYMDKERNLFAIVQFTDKDVTQKVLSCQHFMKDQKLIVQPKEIRNFQPRKKKPPSTTETRKLPALPLIDHEDLVKRLNKCDSVEDQMFTVQHLVELPEEDISVRAHIQNQLQDIFTPYFPGCKIHQFGSSVNGFGIKGCDMDIFLDLNLDIPLKEQGVGPCDPKQLPYTGDVKSIEIVNGIITRESLLAAELQDRVKLVSRILSNSGDIFTNIIAIPGARCPVIKCEHRATSMKCDLSINNRLALQNTRLIKLYSSLDPRIRPLLYSLRYWAKRKEIAGNLNSGPRLTNYALTLLMVYYLQSLPVPALPTVEQLSTLSGEKLVVDGWSCEYATDPSKFPKFENTQTLMDLFKGFFTQFSTFDFSNNVISPRYGDSRHITQFKEQGPDKDKLAHFKISPVCIQDPFVLDHNTTSNVNEKIKFKMIWEFAQSMHKMNQEQFKTVSPESNWGLTLLLDEETVSLDLQDIPFHQNSLLTTSAEGINPSPYSFVIEMQSSKLSSDFLNSYTDLSQMKAMWCQRTYLFVSKLLKDILYFDIDLIKEKNDKLSIDGLDGCLSELSADKEGVQKPTDKGEKSQFTDLNRSPSPSVSNSEVVGEKSIVEEPMSEMYIDDTQTRNGKRHPSGGSENGTHDRKRHKLDDEGWQDLSKEESDKVASHSLDTKADGEDKVLQDLKPTQSNAKTTDHDHCLTDSHINAEYPERLECVKPGSDNPQGKMKKAVLAHVKCSSQQRMWINRRKYQKEVRRTEELGYNMEIKVSELMRKAYCAEKEKADLHTMTFDLIFEQNITHTNTNVLLCFFPPSSAKEFACFYLFLKSFILKLVDKCSPETFGIK